MKVIVSDAWNNKIWWLFS